MMSRPNLMLWWWSVELIASERAWVGILCVHRSVKHYFLLDQGDFIMQFMDMAEDEMKKSMEGKSLVS